MPFVQTKTNANLYYLDTGGDGKPVIVLVHGLLDVPELDYPALIEWLRADYRLIAPSLRGYGQSTPKPRTFAVDFYHRDAADVLALLDALEIDRAHLLGYSDGGEVALIMATEQPTRFQSVGVWGALGYFGPAMRPVAQRMYPGDWIKDEDLAIHKIPDRRSFTLGWVNAIKSMIDAGGDISLSRADRLTAPLLMMLGERDTLNPAAYAQRFVDRTPNGRLMLFDAGHAVHNEAWAAFQAAVSALLKGARQGQT